MNIKEITSMYKPFNTVGHKMSNTMKVLIKAAIKSMKESKDKLGTGLAHTVMTKGDSLSICYADDFPNKDMYFTAINMMRHNFLPEVEVLVSEGYIGSPDDMNGYEKLSDNPESTEILSITAKEENGIYHGLAIIKKNKIGEVMWIQVDGVGGKAFDC